MAANTLVETVILADVVLAAVVLEEGGWTQCCLGSSGAESGSGSRWMRFFRCNLRVVAHRATDAGTQGPGK